MLSFGPPRLRKCVLLASVFGLSAALAGLLSGCGVDRVASSGPSGPLSLQGSVIGGQQAVTGARIYLYSAGKTGNGSAATSMLTLPVYTGLYGAFNITGDYACGSGDDQVYIVATGGNPGLGVGTNNAALVMMTALGRCGDLSPSSFITINEVTTAAAAWALAPFMTSSSHLGASATNSSGLTNAFLDAHLLASSVTGTAATLPSNLTVETGKLYALADALAGCVNSDGTSGCSALFSAATPQGGTAPIDTLSAALNIVKNPGNNVAAVFNVIPPAAPFPTTLTQAPSDWTMSLGITGGGLNGPASLGIESNGTVWVSDYYGALSGFTPQGTALSASGFGVGLLHESYGLTVDTSDNVWVTIEEASPNFYGSVAKFMGVSSGSPGTLASAPAYYDGSLSYPVALSADTNGNVFIGNYAPNSAATVYNSTGAVVSTGLGSGNLSFPDALAVDAHHGVWLGNYSDNTLTHVASDGTILSRPSCCGGIQGLATDAAGNVWTANYISSTFSEVADNGTVLVQRQQGGGITAPVGVAVDAGQNVWFANYHGASISHIAGSAGTVAAGTALSPATGLGVDAGLSLPYGIAADRSGNVWVSNFNNNKLVMFFGLAAPTATPTRPVPVAP